MNVLPFGKQVEIVSALVRGSGVRATVAITETHKRTISKLALRVGEGCARLLDASMRNLEAPILQFDEQWSFVHTKAAHLKSHSPTEAGDQWTFVALDVTSRAVIFHLVGRRDSETTEMFVRNVRSRVKGRPHIAADAFKPYSDAIAVAFGKKNVDFGVLKKIYEGEDDTDDDTPSLVEKPKPEKRHRVRYKGAEKIPMFGDPKMQDVSTSLIERSNLTVRTWQRRFTRRAITFSKSLRHHVAAIALHYAWYNFGHVHSSLRVTPAMQLGITDHVWSVGELVERALTAPEPPPLDVMGLDGPGGQLKLDFSAPTERPKLSVIRGGRS